MKIDVKKNAKRNIIFGLANKIVDGYLSDLDGIQ